MLRAVGWWGENLARHKNKGTVDADARGPRVPEGAGGPSRDLTSTAPKPPTAPMTHDPPNSDDDDAAGPVEPSTRPSMSYALPPAASSAAAAAGDAAALSVLAAAGRGAEGPAAAAAPAPAPPALDPTSSSRRWSLPSCCAATPAPMQEPGNRFCGGGGAVRRWGDGGGSFRGHRVRVRVGTHDVCTAGGGDECGRVRDLMYSTVRRSAAHAYLQPRQQLRRHRVSARQQQEGGRPTPLQRVR